MREKLVSVGTIVCLFALTCLLLVHALAIFPGMQAIHWFFEKCASVFGRLDAPAWVQAVGSIVAIFVAIGIPAWQRYTDKQAERARAYAAAMIVGAAAHARLNMLLATSKATLFEFKKPSHVDVRERAKLVQTSFATTQLPTEEQMLLLSPAMPRVAAEIAKGVAAMQAVYRTLGIISSMAELSPANEAQLLALYLRTRVNLLTAMRCFRSARRRMESFPPLG